MNSLDEVGAVADAVLFEGYLLYPYRASAQKNRLRWQFGVLTPENDGTEPTRSRTEVLLEPKPGCVLRIRLRFLQLQARTPLVDDPQYFPFEEGVPRQVDAEVALADLPQTIPVELPASVEEDGTVPRASAGPLRGRVVVSAVDLPGPYLVHRLRLDVVNDGVCPPGAPREEVLRTSLIAAHTVLAAEPGAWVSMTDPPRWAQPFVDACTSEHTWPVLAGPRRPVRPAAVVADHPARPPPARPGEHDQPLRRAGERRDPHAAHAHADRRREGRGAGHRPARRRDHRRRRRDAAGDPGAPARGDPVAAARRRRQPRRAAPGTAAVVGPQEDAVDPDTDSVLVGTTPVVKGSRVVLRPGRGGDVQDRFLDGASATVHAVVHDVDGGVHVAVSVDGDPAAELQIAHGRFRYFRPDELEVPAVRGAGRGHRQHVPLRRRLRRRGDRAPAGPGAPRRTWSWSTPASAACTWPTSSSTATTCSSSSTRWPAAATRARSTCWSTTWTRPQEAAFDPHGMDPAAVLAQLDGLAAAMGIARPVGRVLVVGCEPASLDEGMGLSAAVAAAVGPAADTVTELVTQLPEGVRG